MATRQSSVIYQQIRAERIEKVVTSDFYQDGGEFTARDVADLLEIPTSSAMDLLDWMEVPKRATNRANMYSKKPTSWLSKRCV